MPQSSPSVWQDGKAPTVSWLICCHRPDESLRSALASCLAQTFHDFELIMVANGPLAPEVVSQVQKWFGDEPRLRLFQTPIQHLTFSLNLGIHHSRADLIARMDADDLASPERLTLQVEYLRQHPEVTVLGTAYAEIDNTDVEVSIVDLPQNDAQIRRALFRGNPICHPTVMYRRKEVLAAGGYLGGLHAEDYDLWARLALQADVRFANLPNVGIGYRIQATGEARRSRTAYAAVAASQVRNFLAGGGMAWGMAAVLTVIKAAFRSRPVKHSPRPFGL